MNDARRSGAGSIFDEFCAAGLWSGVGPAVAKTMRDAGITGPAAVTVQALAALPKFTAKRADRLYNAWVGAGHLWELAGILVPLGLPARWALRLVDALGDGAMAALQIDPWRLLVLPESTVQQADRLARALDPAVRQDDPRRGAALVDWVLARFARDGHTAAPADVVADALRSYGVDVEAGVRAALAGDRVAEVPDPTAAGEQWIARKALWEAESAIAAGLKRLAAEAKPLAKPGAVKAAAKGLDEVQAGAVAHAAEHGVSLLTGGPGTGKSRTIAAVVAVCRAAGVELALAAPTGRAAKRLEELAGHPATTIHRLLGARPGIAEFTYNADNPLPAQLVVVDEASMLDVELAAALIAALATSAHLVIVGDPAQLPSIGPGRVLGDLVDAGAVPVTELSRLYRQSTGGAIARLAAAVRGGELPVVDDPDHEVVVVPSRGSAEGAHRVIQLVTDSIPRVFGVLPAELQVVTPVHGGPAGTQALNRELKRALNPGPGSVRGFDVGDRVVATANHLDASPAGYANGEVGTVLSTGEKSVRVAFTAGESDIAGKALGDLLHGWAITVHRAQGSEWDAVVAVMPPEAGAMLSRPLIYTALTRAKRHLSVVHAAGPALARAVRQIGARPRRTLLQHLMSG
ncbi:AAA family ATPase [Nakamurella lactea]|uniref:AAA family ATPase n=1 Tax=Nakamurella lactea TaxID=459515 RepID=UPI0004045244|nr:AAA family ATPase [Nakamurella lactea]